MVGKDGSRVHSYCKVLDLLTDSDLGIQIPKAMKVKKMYIPIMEILTLISLN